MKPAVYRLGQTVMGHAIERRVYAAATGRDHVLFVGGVHGNEVEGVRLLELFEADLAARENMPCTIHVLRCLNVDGWRRGLRTNARGVDLNRNLPTKDWGALGHDRMQHAYVDPVYEARFFQGESACSEPENVAFVNLIDERTWAAIISIHSFTETVVNYNGEQSREIGELLSRHTGLTISDNIGYPTPGSLGTYAGFERKMPCITIEIFRGMSFYADYATYVDALWRACEHVGGGK